MFEPSFAAKPTEAAARVGLSTCYGIVTSHGGHMTAEETAGGGTAFVLSFPCRKPPAETATPKPGRISGRALVVDDEPDIALSLAEILELGGMQVDMAENGSAAVDRIRAADYDVVLTDVRMPIMDGLTLYRRAEAVKPGLGKHFIFVTGDSMGPMVRAFLDEDNSSCIEKPLLASKKLRRVSE